jgi:hypothetical protein
MSTNNKPYNELYNEAKRFIIVTTTSGVHNNNIQASSGETNDF